MSDAGPPVQDPIDTGVTEEGTPPAPPKGRAKRGMMADPVVRTMAGIAVAIVIVFLISVVGVLLSGVATPTGPRTLNENALSVAGAAIREGDADAATWGAYIAALIANERYSQAQNAIEDGMASTDDSGTAEFAVAEARLSIARKDYQQSISVADEGQKAIKEAYQEKIDAGGQAALTAKNDGLHENWFILALLKADAYKALGDWPKSIEQLDAYLAEYPQAADILVDRGEAKIEAQDTEGAEADFRSALRFIPDDERAIAGLAKIGATLDE